MATTHSDRTSVSPSTDRLAHSPAQAAQKIGVSRTRIYELIAAGDLPARKLGARTLILHADLEQYLTGLPRLQQHG